MKYRVSFYHSVTSIRRVIMKNMSEHEAETDRQSKWALIMILDLTNVVLVDEYVVTFLHRRAMKDRPTWQISSSVCPPGR